MDTVENMVVSLKAQVSAAIEEFDMALIFHCVWKPAAYDEDLLRRMGPSYASQAFLVVRTSLHREMLLALIRLWDTHRGTVRLKSIRNILSDNRVIEALADAAATRMSDGAGSANNIVSWLKGQIEASIGARARDAIALIDTYASESELKTALGNLKLLRNKVLAHRQVAPAEIPDETATSAQIERFMADMTKLMGHLSSIAHAVAYNPDDTADIYDKYAELFWSPAKGEKTEGHPAYRAPQNSGE